MYEKCDNFLVHESPVGTQDKIANGDGLSGVRVVRLLKTSWFPDFFEW